MLYDKRLIELMIDLKVGKGVAILKLASHPDQAREMGTAACAYVVRHFNRNDQAIEFVDLVNHVGKTGN